MDSVGGVRTTGRFVDPPGRVRADGATHLPTSVAGVPRARALTRARRGPTPQGRNGSRRSAGPAEQQARAGRVGSAPTPGWASPVTPHAQHGDGAGASQVGRATPAAYAATCRRRG